ncbi:MAG: hypothetical protein WC374_11550 [Phycisphaerae bacterium]|jgi:hypothetical protein
MISDKVVFVLGAGASIPFGFPSGESLVDQILKIKKEDVASYGRKCEDIMKEMNFDNNLMIQLQKVLRRSQINSIDSFLAQPKNQQFVDLGRLLIAAQLIPHENTDTLFTKRSGSDGNWYNLVWNNLSDYQSMEEFLESLSLTFITFNYDRSFEHYFYTVLKTRFDTDSSKIRGFLKNVIHVHGLLGNHPCINKDDCRPYGKKYFSNITGATKDFNDIKKAMKKIKIVHEVGKFPEKSTINAKISQADRLVFLGFGYQADNIAKLFQGVTEPPKKIMGTSFGLKSAEVSAARNRIAKALHISEGNVDIDCLPELGCYDFLREKFKFS